MNYSIEQVKVMRERYLANPSGATVLELMQLTNKPKRSVIGKLSKEGIYRREVYTTKRGEKPITKLELVASIEEILGLEDLTGLEKAPKTVLQAVLSSIKPVKSENNCQV